MHTVTTRKLMEKSTMHLHSDYNLAIKSNKLFGIKSFKCKHLIILLVLSSYVGKEYCVLQHTKSNGI
jgi:hypothetical protein